MKPLVIASLVAIIVYLQVSFRLLGAIKEEAGRGEEMSPGLIVALSNQNKIVQAAAQHLEEQQQRHSFEPSVDQFHNEKRQQWQQNNHVGIKGAINSPPKFNPPPGYHKHPHQEFEANTPLDPSLIQKRNLKQRHELRHPILPTKVITVVGPESSGSTFLATTLAVAAGARLGTTEKVARRARTVDGKCEIQHLSLPWGWQCESNNDDEIAVNIVDALVPGECFRYELAPSINPVIAEHIFRAEQRQGIASDKHRIQPSRLLKVARDGPQTENEAQILQQCRDKVFISEESNLSCGAKCGSGLLNGYTLYPQRFSVNITSHIEWYLQRGVDVTVVLSTRDRSISKRGKEKIHCKIKEMGQREDEVALELMKEGLEKFGRFGTLGRGRVIVSSYEALISMKKEYLFGLYKQLRINSTYVPTFSDGNEKYVTDANEANNKNAVAPVSISAGQLKPTRSNYTNPNASFLPKKLITVVGLEGSGGAFLSTALGEAVASDGDYRLQHISLPHGWTCESSESRIKANIVDALVPEECFYYEHKLKDLDLEPLNPRKCMEEVRISENNDGKNSKWNCGAKCGEGQLSGLALYPDSFYLNITSHIMWYMMRGVDVKVLLLLRDKTISNKEKLRTHHCNIPPEAADVEDDTAMKIMREAYQKYGEDERVMVVSYEGLMQFKQSYLLGIYKSLGIESTSIPDFVDGNRMFVAPDTQHQMHGSSLHKKGHLN